MPKTGRPRDSEETILRKFWSRVDKSVGACWMWTGPLFENGYGHVGNGRLGSSKAHRVSFLLANGFLPPDKLVCHTCDTPACVNPAHLFIGTVADNTHDMMAKGRDRPPHRGKAHCLRGHAFTPDNVYADHNATSRNGRWRGTHRVCLACQRERNARYYQKTKTRKTA